MSHSDQLVNSILQRRELDENVYNLLIQSCLWLQGKVSANCESFGNSLEIYLGSLLHFNTPKRNILIHRTDEVRARRMKCFVF